jgi:molecular chaperone GrpE
MSPKKKIKIHIDDQETAKNENTDEPAPEDDESLKGEKKDADQPDTESSLKDLEARFKAKEAEAKETYERLLRVSADFENFKKRASREMEEFRKYANQSLLKEMLSVVDNLELAINSSNDGKNADKNLIEGLNLTLNEILRVFEKFNVTPIEAQGKTFDPAYHEAVMREETDDYPENSVMSEFQKGYLIHDRLLRPAMVVVAVPKTKARKDEET